MGLIMLPNVSIIVLNCNGKHFLYDCLSSLSQINYPSSRCEVILVDNGSTDGSVEYLREKFPQIKILALHKNYGFTGGNNKGAKVANGELIVFLNNDTVVDRNWLIELVKVILRDPKIAICGSKIVFMKKPEIVQYAGGYLHLLGGAIFSPFHGDKPDHDFYLVGSICGASFAIKKNVFENIGGFDDDFFLYAEEGDLCLRGWIYGYQVAYAPNSTVFHYAGGTASGLDNDKSQFNDVLHSRLISPATIYYGNRNSIALLIKNFQTKNLLPGLVFSYLYLFLQLILLLRNKPRHAKLLIKAGIWPFKNLKMIWRKRLQIQKRRKVSDNWLIKSGLLLSISETLKLREQLKNDLNC